MNYLLKKIYYNTFLIIKYFLIELFNRKTIIINATSYPCYKGFIPKFRGNWGDDINYILPQYLLDAVVIPYRYSIIGRFLKKKKNVLFIGSVITGLSNSKTIIIGAGLSPDQTNVKYANPYKVLRVRGPLSRMYLIERGIPCPTKYGDPALILPYIYKPIIKNHYKIGFIPHFLDKERGVIDLLSKYNNCIIIDPTNYGNWTSFINNICSCDIIFSSSLHGLIISDAYNIPNIWTEFFFKVNRFKYHDYFYSVNRELKAPYIFDFNRTITELVELKKDYKPIKLDIQDLFKQIQYELQSLKEL